MPRYTYSEQVTIDLVEAPVRWGLILSEDTNARKLQIARWLLPRASVFISNELRRRPILEHLFSKYQAIQRGNAETIARGGDAPAPDFATDVFDMVSKLPNRRVVELVRQHIPFRVHQASNKTLLVFSLPSGTNIPNAPWYTASQIQGSVRDWVRDNARSD